MFSFFEMIANYEDRVLSRYQDDVLIVSTAAVTDGKDPFETAVCHPFYNNDEMIIVESYKTRQEAYYGHKKWVNKMLSDNLPEYLDDCCNSHISNLCRILVGDFRYYIGNFKDVEQA